MNDSIVIMRLTLWRMLMVLAVTVGVGLIALSNVVRVAYTAPWLLWLPLQLVGFVLIGVCVLLRRKIRDERTAAIAEETR
ncbi:hypothetical protein [Nocardia sp. N2S4-5]|uniref:hypothetical protein n=1 Tax=Nocardia sp. N2S4-5 TaxID=3351565 RepID=UPI0037D7F7AB